MQNCIFCKIASGEAPARKVWENEKYMAILDIFPKIKGQVVLFSKEHLPSYIFDLPDETIKEFFMAAKEAAKIMNNALKTERVAQRMEGLEVEHAHIKLYPVYSTEEYSRDSNLPPKRMPDNELDQLFKNF